MIYEEFLGYHSEWNMGSPGGWDYQRMAQQIGKYAWEKIKKKSGIEIDLDFDAPVLNPVPQFAQLILRAHKKNFPHQSPFIALVAEQETLDKVGENIRIVKYLNSLPDTRAILIAPHQLTLEGTEIFVDGNKITSIFLDFNNNVILKLKQKYALDALLEAIRQGIVTNPRGMEPIGAKGVFEAITSDYSDRLNPTTLKRTPWTRQFYPRSTTGPQQEQIPDLIQWVRDNWHNVILKPVHGYSGKGIIIGHKESDKDRAIQIALDSKDYIVQPLIPLTLWAEEFPWLDKERTQLILKCWQTDFRCFVTDVGLIGFVTRFGGIPTNVGSGGGVQSSAILRAPLQLAEVVKKINETILNLGFDFIWKLQQELDEMSIEIGNVYLLGPIMNTLRPRIITEPHINQLREYAQNLWHDALLLEQLWLEGTLDKYVQISPEEETIAKLAPWRGSPALIAADGLFGFVERTHGTT